MNWDPNEALKDAETYVRKHGFSLSKGTKLIITKIEELAKRHNRSIYEYVVLSVFLQEYKDLRALMIRKGADPDEALMILNKEFLTSVDDDPYPDDEDTYSDESFRGGYRAQLVDFSMGVARRNRRTEILDADVLEGYLESQDEVFPSMENSQWSDEALHVPYNTLSHIYHRFEKSLWIKFDDIRDELGLINAAVDRKAPIEMAPSYLKPSVMDFLSDNPEYRKNCFLIMPFSETSLHKAIHEELKNILLENGFFVHRADDKSYTNDVFSNIETYIYGCKFGVSVYDRALSDAHNPNVSLEAGYMLGQKKDICLLKEKTVVALPSDLQGKLYVEFDSFNMKQSLKTNVEKWLKDKKLKK